jgi:hypothetical protein
VRAFVGSRQQFLSHRQGPIRLLSLDQGVPDLEQRERPPFVVGDCPDQRQPLLYLPHHEQRRGHRRLRTHLWLVVGNVPHDPHGLLDLAKLSEPQSHLSEHVWPGASLSTHLVRHPVGHVKATLASPRHGDFQLSSAALLPVAQQPSLVLCLLVKATGHQYAQQASWEALGQRHHGCTHQRCACRLHQIVLISGRFRG